MIKPAFSAMLALMIAACSGAPEEKTAGDDPAPALKQVDEPNANDAVEDVADDATDDGSPAFKASGNEPGWMLTITDTEIVLIWNYGEDRLTVPAPPAENANGALTYNVAESDLYIVVTDQFCYDDATGMPHPNTVTVVVGGDSLRGCGGDPASLLMGPEWVVEDIDNGGVVDNSNATLTFGDDGRVSGSGSCNNYSGSYTIAGEGISFGPIAATKRACAPALMDQEQKFFAVLSETNRFDFDQSGALILIADPDKRLLARRISE